MTGQVDEGRLVLGWMMLGLALSGLFIIGVTIAAWAVRDFLHRNDPAVVRRRRVIKAIRQQRSEER